MLGEGGGVTRGVEVVAGWLGGGGEGVVVGQDALDLAGDGGGRVNEGYIRADEALDGGAEEGVVGAAENELVDAGVE